MIELNPALSTRYHQKLDADPSVWAPKGKYANAIVKGAAASVMPSFDPFAMFYGDLSVSAPPFLCVSLCSEYHQHVYADTVLLFHDPLGGDHIGAVWQPNLRSARPFRALGGFSSIPSQKVGISVFFIWILVLITGACASGCGEGEGEGERACSPQRECTVCRSPEVGQHSCCEDCASGYIVAQLSCFHSESGKS